MKVPELRMPPALLLVALPGEGGASSGSGGGGARPRAPRVPLTTPPTAPVTAPGIEVLSMRRRCTAVQQKSFTTCAPLPLVDPVSSDFRCQSN